MSGGFFKNVVLRNAAYFRGKHLYRSLLFNNVTCLTTATLLTNNSDTKTIYLKNNTRGCFRMYTCFFISITFVSNVRLKLTKNEANAMQHPEAKFLLFEN